MAGRTLASRRRDLMTLSAILAAILGAPATVSAVEKASEQVSSFYGSLSHTIPIEVPGFRGHEPRIALSYSSEGNNGLVGVGWSLSGFSTVERVNAGLGSPRFDSADIYLLDGQELYPCQVGSISPSCTTGGTHSTKIETYLKIKYEAGPNTWTIWGKEGTRTILSPIINVPANAYVAGGTLRWGVSSRIDTDSNTVNYTWSCQDGDCYPSAANYSGYQVTFFKEARPDWLSWAGATVLGETRYRLRSIIVWATTESAHIRGYKLTYQQSPLTGRSLLTSVQQYGKDLVHDGAGLLTGGTTLPARTFAYQNDVNGKSFPNWGTPATLPAYSSGVTWANHVNSYPTGDGSSLLKTGGSISQWDAGADSTYAIASGDGYMEWRSSQPVTDGKAAGLSFGNTDVSLNDIDFALWETDANGLRVVESGVVKGPAFTRADGDALRIEVVGGVVYYRKNGSLLYQSTVVPTYPLRVDASLRGASASLDSVVISGSLIGVNAWCQNILYSGDFNGDGRTDQLCYSSLAGGTIKVSLSADYGLQAPTTWLTGGLTNPVFADFNNDGKTDLARHDPSTAQFFVSLSSGSSFAAWTLWGTAVGTLPGGAAVDCRVNPASVGSGDFNGDGVADVYCHLFGPNLQFVGLSTGTSFTFSLFSDYECDTSSSDQQVGAIDFDGDGKDDWYCIGTSTTNILSVFPSTGNSFVFPAHGSLNFCNGSGYVLGDLNGDGRTDVTCMNTGAVALSTGRSFQTIASYGGWCGGGQALAADVDGDGASEVVCNNAGAGATDIQVRKWNGGGQAPALGAAETWKSSWCGGLITNGDFNGDGKSDLYCKSTVAPAVAGTGGFIADLMNGTDNGLRGSSQITYVPSSSFVHTNNPSVRPVVSSIVAADGLGGTATTSFIYSGGLMDRRERRFLGFRYARTTMPCIAGESACPFAETWFYQDLASAGAIEKTLSRNGGGNILAMQTFAYTTNGTSLPRTSMLTTENTYSYDGIGCPSSPCTQERIVTTTHTYDPYGNKTSTTWGGDSGTSKDDRSTTWDYNPNPTAYIVGHVAREQRFDSEGGLLAATRYSYDITGPVASWTTSPTKGHMTHKEAWLDPGNRWLTSRFEFDSYGNTTKVTDATAVSIETTYDATRHLFPETIKNLAVPGDVVATTWDPACGVPTQTLDANAQMTTFQSDALCRRTRTDTPLLGFTIRSYRDFGLPQQRIVLETPPAVSGGPNKFVASHFDGNGRTFRTVSSGATAGVPILADTVYNQRGLVQSRTAPYYNGDATYSTTYEYDSLDRITLITHPDSNTIARSYGLWSETTTDENGRPHTLLFDAYRQVTGKEVLLSGSTLTTRASYDALGRRTSMEDALGNSWGWQFDSLDRRFQEVDPDSGTKVSTFDDSGRLKTTTNAKGERIEYDYDSAGRNSVKRTFNSSNVLTGTVTHAYGEARAGYFNKGRRTTVSGPGTTSIALDYDARGRLSRQQRTIDGVVHTSSKTFDAGDRLLTETHPDGAVGPYTYDLAGRVTSLSGIITSVSYDASGRPVMRNNFNGTTTTRGYSPERGLLISIASGGSYNLQDLSYTHDPTGRVESVASNHPDESWTFGYDDLYRLTSATSPNPALTQAWTYDEINRISFNSRIGSYAYPASGSARPHAPLSAGPKSYAYDAAGQTSVGDGRTFTWSVDGLPTLVSSSAYSYDGMDLRIKKTVGGVTTLYPFGDDYEITGALSTKYISVRGVGLVAKRTGGQTYWLHTDRLGSIQVVSNSAANEVLRRTYRPSGEKYQDSSAHVESRGWMGQRTDANGLTFLHARYFDAPLGSFVSPDSYDPWDPGVGPNRYIYGLGDPTNNPDPSGHRVCVGLPTSIGKKQGGIMEIAVGVGCAEYGRGYTPGGWGRSGSGDRAWVPGYGTGNGGGRDEEPHGGYGGGGSGNAGSDGTNTGTTSGTTDNTTDNTSGTSGTEGQSGSSANGSTNLVADVLGKLVNLPNTVAGLIIGTAPFVSGTSILFDTKISVDNNAVQFTSHPFILALPDAAGITLGNVILYDAHSGPDIFGAHEEAHTRQGETLGMLYIPAHAAWGGYSMATSGGNWWQNNYMEKGPDQVPAVPFPRP